jgi:tyrosyl-tRNA synthetase
MEEKSPKLLKKNIVEIIGQDDLIRKIQEGKKLKVKLGVDPTSADLHLGHAVVLRKLKDFQEAGHEIIFLIGDYTAKIGDPSGRDKTRPMPTDDEIEKNAESYLNQVGKILDVEKATIKKNSEWFSKMNLAQVIKLASNLTVASILERDDFEKRFQEGIDISLHELLYPLMQAYDSVMLKCDLEIGGTDQKFNLLAGRELMRKLGKDPQAVMTLPILIGTDGKRKMSKSLGNYIGLNDSPAEMYGRIMSIPDELIVSYYQLCTDVTKEALAIIKKELNPSVGEEGKNPRDIKARLAKLIVEMYHNVALAEEAEGEFIRVFREKKEPSEIQELNLKKNNYALVDLVQRAGTSSLSEAKRLVEQGGVKIDGKVQKDPRERFVPEDGVILQIGKRRFFKIKLVGG